MLLTSKSTCNVTLSRDEGKMISSVEAAKCFAVNDTDCPFRKW